MNAHTPGGIDAPDFRPNTLEEDFGWLEARCREALDGVERLRGRVLAPAAQQDHPDPEAACALCNRARREHRPGYSAQRCAFHEPVPARQEEPDGQAVRWRHAVAVEVHRALMEWSGPPGSAYEAGLEVADRIAEITFKTGVRELVEAAFKEGHWAGGGFGRTADDAWEGSEARRALAAYRTAAP